ncbi:MAG: phycobiliprotein lyase [Cyanobacteria bacterium J06641_5]
MDVRDFLSANIGKWFSQRTQYEAIAQTQNSKRGEVEVTALDATAAELVDLCQRAGLEPGRILMGLRTQWEADSGSLTSSRKQTGSVVVAFVAGETETRGQLWQIRSDASDDGVVCGRYEFRPAGVNAATLLIDAETDGISQAERLWFAGENLRLRTIHAKAGDREQMVFYSEIRRIPLQPKTSEA